jgi:glyceraldehyde 3-phosphate dehydrogenase
MSEGHVTLKVAINGLGRIGRLVLRLALKHPQIQIVAVNDVVPADNLAYLLKYDSTHGPIKADIKTEGVKIVIDGSVLHAFNEKDPANLPWSEHGVDYVIESTGHFANKEGAERHLQAGAKRVVITAPVQGDIPTFVMGVNHELYRSACDRIVSNASCTTNCLALLTKVLLDNFGIEEGLMTTIHAMTASQPTVDGPSKKDWRGGRGALQNIIPASTGAAKAVGLCLPQVQGKLTGMAFRVPVADVSVVDLTVRLVKSTTYAEICQKMKESSQGDMKGMMYYCEDEVVSSDFIGSTYSSIFDVGAGIALNDRFYKLVAWYDNEMGYAARVVDLVGYMGNQEKKESK